MSHINELKALIEKWEAEDERVSREAQEYAHTRHLANLRDALYNLEAFRAKVREGM